MQSERNLVHHRKFNCYDHSISVACTAVWIAKRLGLSVNLCSLIRGALLHDYFLYDWRVSKPSERMHGFAHAKIALQNARDDFDIDDIQADIISKHMFPLNIAPPRYKESFVVTIADKVCASCEIASVICNKTAVLDIERRLRLAT